MTITNISKPVAAITNSTSRVVSYETFDTLTTTFNSETRTFDQMGTTWSNVTRPSVSMTNTSKPS